jgi:5-methylcytosine-specific restriction endonuclease McrA
MYIKSKIPKAIREQVWLQHVGPKYQSKCNVVWCKNQMDVFNFQCGHNIPESKGGKTEVSNILPICSRCNLSMGSRFTIDEWNAQFNGTPKPKKWWSKFLRRLNPFAAA